MRLADKIVLITGSGSGIGRSSALLFAKEGAFVVVNDLNADKGNETVEEINSLGGGLRLFMRMLLIQIPFNPW